MNINQNKIENEKRTRFWIHKVDNKLFSKIDKQLVLKNVSKRSNVFKNIQPNDFIILFSKIMLNKSSRICFYAYTMVENVFEDSDLSVNIKLKGMKYFEEPIPYKEIVEDLEIFNTCSSPASVMNSNYKEISSDDFYKIHDLTLISQSFPRYLRNISFRQDVFILNSIQALYNTIKLFSNVNQIEIIKFIELLNDFLKDYGFKISFNDLKNFYARNVWKLGFKHIPSRNSNKFVRLYTESGMSVDFGYISLE